MPHHDKTKTPPELRRAPKGSTAGECRFRHTQESRAYFAVLQARGGKSDAETLRAALRVAAACRCAPEDGS